MDEKTEFPVSATHAAHAGTFVCGYQILTRKGHRPQHQGQPQDDDGCSLDMGDRVPKNTYLDINVSIEMTRS